MTRITRFVLAGFGNVGRQVARAVLADPAGRLEIAALAVRNRESAKRTADELGLAVPLIGPADAPAHAEVLVECATFESFRELTEPSLRAGSHVIAVSAGALGANLDLVEIAESAGATLQIASGALPGLDILRSAKEGGIDSVRLESQILPSSLEREPYVREHGIDLAKAERGPVPVFEGSAREAARLFPRHFNVAVALALAGCGLDRTQVAIRANGTIGGTEHKVVVESAVAGLEMKVVNRPSPENRRTSRIVAPSIIAALKELASPLRIGS